MDFTDEELQILQDELEDRAHHYRHYPNEMPEDFGSVYVKVNSECKRRKFWWTR